MIGQQFGKLTVIKKDTPNGSGNIRWLCQCQCGLKSTPTGTYLRLGKAKSCGCLIGSTKYNPDTLTYATKIKYWGQAVRLRDNYKCQTCGETQGGIHAHHIIPKEKDIAKAFDVENGITLCSSCHKLTHERNMI